MSVSPDLVIDGLGFSQKQKEAIFQKDATQIAAGSHNFNHKDLFGSGERAAGIEFTNTLPSGVTIGTPLNFPVGTAGNWFFTTPGTNTPTFTGFTWFTSEPVWQAGKSYFYQFKKLPSGAFAMWGNQQDGIEITTATAGYTVPATGSEVVVGSDAVEGDIFRQRFTGTLTTSPLSIGSPVTGTIQSIKNILVGRLEPTTGGNTNQQWPTIYPNTNVLTISSVQKHNNEFRIFAGSNVTAAVPTYDLCIDYTKV